MTAPTPPKPSRVVLSNGMTAHVEEDVLKTWLPRITSVGIVNLADVRRHRIAAAFGSVSHVVQFAGGGELRYAYNAAGELIELSGKALAFTVSPSGQVLFRPYR